MSIKPVVTYDYSLAQSIAAITAKNHVSLFNPVGSGKVLSAGGVFVSYTMLATGTLTAPMRGFRCSSASGGTLVDVADICKFNSAHPDPVGEIRIGNPTCTLGPAFFSSPPGVEKRAGVTHQVDVPPGAGPFLIRPGEGIVLRQGISVLDLVWNLSIVWAER